MAARPPTLRQFLSDAAVYGLGQLVVRLTSFILIPLYADRLSRADLGLLSLLETYRTGFTLLAGLGLGEATGYYIARQKRDFRETLGTALLATLAGCLVLSVVLFAARVPLATVLLGGPENAYTVVFICLCGPLDTLHNLCLGALRYADRARLFALLACVETAVRLGLNAWLVAGLDLGMAGILWSFVASFAVVIVLDLVLFAGAALRRARRAMVQPLVRYGVAVLPYQVSSLAGLNADRVILEHYVGLEPLAAYSIAGKVAAVVGILVQPLQSALRPHLYRAESGDSPTIRRVGGLMVGFTLASVLVVLLAAPELVAKLGAGKYEAALPLVPLTLGALAGRLAFSVLGFGPLYAGRPKVQGLVVFCAMLVNVVGNIVLVPRLGVYGAAWAGFGGSTVMAVLGAIATRRVLGSGQPLAEMLSGALMALCLGTYYLSPAAIPLGGRLGLLAIIATTAAWMASRAGYLRRVRDGVASWRRRRAGEEHER